MTCLEARIWPVDMAAETATPVGSARGEASDVWASGPLLIIASLYFLIPPAREAAVCDQKTPTRLAIQRRQMIQLSA